MEALSNSDFNFQMIPLKKLFLSERNVRTVQTTKEEDNALKASIAAQGIKQNLVVHKVGNKFGVHGGGRRYRLAMELVDEKIINLNFLVPCKIEDEDDITATSLAENSGRAKMHPADEFMAYNRLIEEGRTIKEVAAAYGVSQMYVKRRMKLASLSPAIIEHFKNGKLSFDEVTAFTVSDSHEAQEAAYKELSPNRLSAYRIKEMLLNNAPTTDDPLFKLVGMDAYKKAGGTVTSDLFENDIYVDVPELLNSLATQKLNTAAESILADGWKWVEISLSQYGFSDFHSRINAKLKGVPKELTDSLKKLEKEQEQLDAIDYDDWTDEHNKREEELAIEIEKLEEKQEQYRNYTKKQKSVSGVLVTHNHGEIVFDFGLVKKADMKAAFPPKNAKANNDIDGESADIDEPVESNALASDLNNFLLQALQSEIMQDDKLASDLMIFSLASRLLGDSWNSVSLNVSIHGTDITSTDGIEDTDCYKAISEFKSKLPLEWLHIEDEKEQFESFCALTNTEKKRILSFCVAMSYQYNHNDGIDQVVRQSLSFDISQHWKPTSTNYFNRIKKDDLLTIGVKMIDEQWKDDNHKKPKSLLADVLEEEAALRSWMPDCMQ